MKYTITIHDLHKNKKLNPTGCETVKKYRKMVKELIVNGIAYDYEVNQELPKNINFIDCISTMNLKNIYDEAKLKMGDKFITLKDK